MEKRIISIMLILIIAVIMSGCSNQKKDNNITISSISFSETEERVEINKCVVLSLNFLPREANTSDISFCYDNSFFQLLWTEVGQGAKVTFLKASFKALKLGESLIYAKTSSLTSNSVSIVVYEKEQDTSRTVYINAYGSKYHFSASCCGKNAYAVTLNKARSKGKTACLKCC